MNPITILQLGRFRPPPRCFCDDSGKQRRAFLVNGEIVYRNIPCPKCSMKGIDHDTQKRGDPNYRDALEESGQNRSIKGLGNLPNLPGACSAETLETWRKLDTDS